jgi:hypothetical protein
MTLNPHPSYPMAGCYVLKLHRDARPQAGAVCGRIEHIASGEQATFASAEALLAWLSEHAARTRAVTASTGPLE